MTPAAMRGQLRYYFPSLISTEVRSEISGDIYLTPAKGTLISEPGFMLVSSAPLEFRITPIDAKSVSVPRPRTLGLRSGTTMRTGALDRGLDYFAKTALYAARVFVAPENVEYLFVQWDTPGATCDFAFSLMKLTATGMEEVGHNAYGCDA
jgi:hypothetical protein